MEVLKDLAPIKISETAINALREIANQEQHGENSFLRIGVKNGGCAGFSYIMQYDEKTENDMVYEIGGIIIITDKDHLIHIQGMLIDYDNGLNNRGFIYANPNANSTCGCGTSFA